MRTRRFSRCRIVGVVLSGIAALAVAEPAPMAPLAMPKLDAEGLRQLGPEHLQVVYCGARAVVTQMPENRRRLERLAAEPGSRAMFDGNGKAETTQMLDRTEAEAKRLVKDSARAYREKAGEKIGDGPCKAYAAAIEQPEGAVAKACHARYRLALAEKLEAEVRGPAVAPEFRERFERQLAQDLEQARSQSAQADASAKAADGSYDGGNCRFDRGIFYRPRRKGP